MTGGTGFIGGKLILKLLTHKFFLKVGVRKFSIDLPVVPNLEQVKVGSLSPDCDWSDALFGVEVVIHLAARAHILSESEIEPLVEFRKANTDSTLSLARQAAAANVRRFIFISSIGVNGNGTSSECFSVESIPEPKDPYAMSKFEAEEALKLFAKSVKMEVVIIRPPLVYGADAPGNFGLLLKVVHSGIPLPLGSIHNRRSMVSLENLIDLIITCIYHRKAANQTFLISDDEDISTTELLKRMAIALGKPSRLIPVSPVIIKAVAKILGKKTIARRLCDSLQIDISHTRKILDWEPPVSVDEALKRTASEYLNKMGKR